MQQKAVDSAIIALERAKRSFALLNTASDTHSAREAWIGFLMASESVYAKLSTGAVGNGRSVPWMGRKKKERKDDHILEYVHQARNSADKGIDEIVERSGGFLSIGSPGETKFEIRIGNPEEVSIRYSGDKPVIHAPRSFIRLSDVTNTKYGDTFEAPFTRYGIGQYKRHLSAIEVASYAIQNLEKLIDEAARYVVGRGS